MFQAMEPYLKFKKSFYIVVVMNIVLLVIARKLHNQGLRLKQSIIIDIILNFLKYVLMYVKHCTNASMDRFRPRKFETYS